MVATTPQARIAYESCPLCEKAVFREVRKVDCRKHRLYHPVVPDKMIWMSCQSCGHVFTDGFLSPDALSTIFRRTHLPQKPGHEHEIHRPISARIVERVVQFVDAGRWLDIGFGNGSLLFTAEEYGFEPVGFDLRPTSVEEIKKLGVKAYCVDLMDWKDTAPFSVISMADVLEHMPFPKKALARAHSLIEPGGVLFISLPHYNSPTWKMLDKTNENPYWMEIEHYHNFSRRRLIDLLAEAGFQFKQYGISERYRAGMEIIFQRL